MNNSNTTTALNPNTTTTTDNLNHLFETCSTTYIQLNIGLGYAMLVIGLIALTGNVVICIVIITNKHLHTVQYILLLSLAFVDLLISSTLLPYEALGMITYDNDIYIYSPFWVVFGNALWYVMESLSIMSLLLISIERFIAIRYPFKHMYLSTATNAAAGIAFVWLYNVVTFTLLYFLQGWPEEDTYDFLVPIWLEWTVLVLNIILPCGLNILIYIYVLKITSNHRKRMKSLESSHQPFNSKSIKLFSYVMMAFLVFWLPCLLFQIYLSANQKYLYTCAGNFTDSLLGNITFLNCVINAFVYGATSKKFKNGYKKLFYCKCNQTSIEPSSS